MFFNCTVRLVNAVECVMKWRSLICERHIYVVENSRW